MWDMHRAQRLFLFIQTTDIFEINIWGNAIMGKAIEPKIPSEATNFIEQFYRS
jgi:hypothetical protein